MFVTFEGIEGAGKSTLAAAVHAALLEAGVPTLATREPGGTALGERLRALFLDPELPMEPLSELFVVQASRAALVSAVIRPALAAGKTVLCDRYYDATVAYQGYGRGLDPEAVLATSQLASGGLEPDLTLLVDVPIEVSARRLHERAQHTDRMEREGTDFHGRVRTGYLALAKRFERIVVLDGTEAPALLAERALAIVHRTLGVRG